MNQLKIITAEDKTFHWFFALILPRTQSVKDALQKQNTIHTSVASQKVPAAAPDVHR
jgi:hypothetical protein